MSRMLAVSSLQTAVRAAAPSVAIAYPALRRGFASAIDIVDEQIALLNKAQDEFKTFDQAQVDKIFRTVAHVAAKQRVPLAKHAVDETRLGKFEDKVIKNSVACELPLSKYRNAKTCGIISRDKITGLTRIAIPVGPVASILPTTNPTSTAILKSLFALKTRNAMLFLPHPRAAKCTAAAVKVCHDAAVAAGAPFGILQCVAPSKEASSHVMHHNGVKIILATGGPAMVHSSYESGKPAIGVGSGNAAVLIDETADLKGAVGSIVVGKTFDNGTICASEQSIVVVDSVYDKVKQLFQERGVHFVYNEDRKKLGEFLIVDGHINADIVGQAATTIAERIGISVPPHTVILAAEASEVGPSEAFSYEKLSPVLGMYRASDFENAVDISNAIVNFGGQGHTAAIYTKDRSRMESFAMRMPAFHLMANMPTSLGAIGSAYNFNVDPSLTLGVGSIAGSSLSGNLTPFHLLDIKTLAEGQEHMEHIKLPPALYFNRNCTEEALNDLSRDGTLKRALIITDKFMVEAGHVRRVVQALESKGLVCSVFDAVEPDPNMACVRLGVRACQTFKPDTIICLGGGSPMDAGKYIRVQYENPDITIDDLSARFVEVRRRTLPFPEHGSLIKKLVCIPTTSGTASEVTPFSVITADDGQKHPIVSYRMTPDIAIVDSSFCDKLPLGLIANAGLDAVTHAVEAYVSVVANDFTKPSSIKALKLLFENLSDSFAKGDDASREKVHHGATLAGIAFANAYLGICHSLSHKVGAKFHLPHGMVNAILLPHVIRYNAEAKPSRQGYYPSYTHPQSLERYAEISRQLGLQGNTDTELMEAFITRFGELSKELKVPQSFAAAGIDKDTYMAAIPYMALNAFDDECTVANPRFPMVEELEEVLKSAYYGDVAVEAEVLKAA